MDMGMPTFSLRQHIEWFFVTKPALPGLLQLQIDWHHIAQLNQRRADAGKSEGVYEDHATHWNINCSVQPVQQLAVILHSFAHLVLLHSICILYWRQGWRSEC